MQTAWFWILFVLWSLYFVTEGFDFGVGMLLPILGRSEDDRRTMIQSIGPVWDGNEVWLVIAGAATFAAFPVWYATMFSGFYVALLLLLVLLITRIVSFEWRGKADSTSWRGFWTWVNAIASLGIPLVWGIALSSLLHGVPVSSAQEFTGTFWDLFTPYTVFAGVAFVVLFALHGAVYLGLRTSGDLRARAERTAARLAVPAALIGAAFLIWTLIVGIHNNDQSVFPGIVVVVLAAAAAVAAVVLTRLRRDGLAFIATGATIGLAVATLFTELYPRVMVSSTSFADSLTTTNSSSGHYTLVVISIFTLVLLPVILLYQGWAYHVFRARLGQVKQASSPVDLLGPKGRREAEYLNRSTCRSGRGASSRDARAVRPDRRSGVRFLPPACPLLRPHGHPAGARRVRRTSR